jgi:hypothetical protein
MSTDSQWPGPGAVRVGQFIGRIGVVSLPAVEVGLGLDERVVRRHVAKLEAARWLGRAPWVWGQGSVVWLTDRGLDGTALGGLQAVKLPPAPTTVDHGVALAWTAARVERRGHRWKSARELALDPAQWTVRIPDERGASHDRLPDLAVWLPNAKLPVAVIVEHGHRREDRQRRILEAWRSAVHSGRYAGVRYDCASASVAEWIKRLADKAWFKSPEFVAAPQPRRNEILDLVIADPEPVVSVSPEAPPPVAAVTRAAEGNDEAARRPRTPTSTRVEPEPRPVPPAPETPEEAADRERRYRAIMGIPEPKARRRWRR